MIDGQALCKNHILGITEVGCRQLPPALPEPPAAAVPIVSPPALPPVEVLPAKTLRAMMQAVEPEILIRHVEAVVYYVGDPETKLVKIGTSTALKNRVRKFRMYRPRAILLATEPGTYPVERKRHHQFSALREPLPSGETEWFRKAPVLMDHVGQLRLKYGILCPGRPVYSSWIAPVRRR